MASLITDSELNPKKRRKVGDQETQKSSINNNIEHSSNKTRWSSEKEQNMYSKKLIEALRQVREKKRFVSGNGREIRETADRVLAVSAKGESRWSRAILRNRVKFGGASNRHTKKKAKAGNGGFTGCSRLKRKEFYKGKKRLPAVQRKIKVLSRLIPGCRKASVPTVLEEAKDFIAALEMQVRTLTMLTELFAGGSVLPMDRLGSS